MQPDHIIIFHRDILYQIYIMCRLDRLQSVVALIKYYQRSRRSLKYSCLCPYDHWAVLGHCGVFSSTRPSWGSLEDRLPPNAKALEASGGQVLTYFKPNTKTTRLQSTCVAPTLVSGRRSSVAVKMATSTLCSSVSFVQWQFVVAFYWHRVEVLGCVDRTILFFIFYKEVQQCVVLYII